MRKGKLNTDVVKNTNKLINKSIKNAEKQKGDG